MRTLFGILGLGLFTVALGCQHVGGKCDQCSASPGDASLYSPFNNYQTPKTPVPVPPYIAPEEPVTSKKGDSKKDSPNPMAETLGAPKEMPKK